MESKTTKILLNMKRCYDNIQSAEDRMVVSSVMGTFERISKHKTEYGLIQRMFTDTVTYPVEETIGNLLAYYDVSRLPGTIYETDRTKHLIDFLCQRTKRINERNESHFLDLRFDIPYVIKKMDILLKAFDERRVEYDFINIDRTQMSGKISKWDILALYEIIRDK